MRRAIGISIHTGWGACVVVAGSRSKPEIVANEVVKILDDAQRFCFHMAADMPFAAAEKWIVTAKKNALGNAKRALAPLIAQGVTVCAIVAKPGDPGPLEDVLASHPRLHTAEGCFYRDVFREACGVPSHIVTPASLDVASIGKISGPPWGKDQKMAALAAWKLIER
jgi:hypothetical protein